MEGIVKRLIAAMTEMTVIDSHEHMPSEASVNARPADVFTHIFAHYSITTAISAGGPDREFLHDLSVPIERRWRAFSPVLDAIRDSGYARAAQTTARELYGIDEINDRTYLDLQGRLQDRNKPGLFQWVFNEKCKIETILNQGEWVGGIAKPVLRANDLLCENNAERARQRYESLGLPPEPRLADLRSFLDAGMSEAKAAGCWGWKISGGFPMATVDDDEALGMFRKLLDGRLPGEEFDQLDIWVTHYGMRQAPRHGFVVAVHCGIIWCNWSDFRVKDPLDMIPFLEKYRDTRFDLYHGGIPWVREIAVIANSYPNAHLDLVWCHQISPYMTQHMLNEWIDLVPVSKIIGFGGDNCFSPEKTYGVLVLARENIARALAVRVVRGEMSEDRAVDICRGWLYDNPKRIYGL